MPRVRHHFRPPWYSEEVSKNVGRVAGVTTRPAFTDDFMEVLWNNKKAAREHPRAKTRLVQTSRPKAKLSPQLPLDSKSLARSRMFADQLASVSQRGAANEREGNFPKSGSRNTGLVRQWHDANAARQMHVFNSPERVFRSAYHSVKPSQQLPYKPATPRSGLVPKPTRPSSGVSPKIAGVRASAIMKGTGALGAIPAVVHLLRGGSLGSLAGHLPEQFRRRPQVDW